MTMDTDSNAEEEGADESRDGQDESSPGTHTFEDVAVQRGPGRAFSAPCSPSGSRLGPGPGPGHGSSLGCVSGQRAGERPSSLPPSSPRAVVHNDWAYDPAAVGSAGHQNPGMQKDKGMQHCHTQSNIHTVHIVQWSTRCWFNVEALS